MGMIFELIPLPDDAGEALLRDPKLIHPFLLPTTGTAAAGGFLSRLFSGTLFGASDLPPELAKARAGIDARRMDLDKAWHGLHYLLAGDDGSGDQEHPADRPELWLLFGGRPVGEEDVGYGPARFLSSADVARWAEFLASVPEDSLRARFDPPRMESLGIYPSIWDEENPEENCLGYVLTYLRELRSFTAAAAKRGEGALLFLC